MDRQKAMQILKSPSNIDVSYNGSPVWIEGVNGDVAKVRFLNDNRHGEVPVSGLTEGK